MIMKWVSQMMIKQSFMVRLRPLIEILLSYFTKKVMVVQPDQHIDDISVKIRMMGLVKVMNLKFPDIRKVNKLEIWNNKSKLRPSIKQSLTPLMVTIKQ